MPFNGSGGYTPPAASFPAVDGTLITAAKFNANVNDMATALSTCLTTDGQSTMTGAIKMGGNKVINLGAGTALLPSLAFGGTTTGLYQPAASTVGYAIAGLAIGSMTSTGLNGMDIGTTTPGLGSFTTLTVSGSIIAAITGSRVKTLKGTNNATNPTFQFDLTADFVVLRNPANGATVVRTALTPITVDINVAGPIVNGRDIVAAFGLGTWLYVYYIWNGTTLALIVSTAGPATGPTLPATYTHWAFATTLRRKTATGDLMLQYSRGARVFGSAEASYGLSPTVAVQTINLQDNFPPEALDIQMSATGQMTHNTAGVTFTYVVTPNLAGTGTTSVGINVTSQVVGVVVTNNAFGWLPVITQSVGYKVNAVPTTSNNLTVYVIGFTVPNGDS